jgi:acetylornithine/N-succinyldiaminopimelate aminotransferase
MSFTRPSWAGSLAERGAACVMPTYARYPIELLGGNGSRVRDSDGREYLDLVAGIAVNVLGHGHPAITEAIRSSAEGLLHVSNLYWTEPMVGLAEELCAAAGMERAFFCNSGAESVEAALKLARKARPGRSRVLCCERSFHGRTTGALSITAQPKYQAAFQPLLPGATVLPFGDLTAAEGAFDSDVAAFVVEVVQGEGGIRPAPDGYLKGLRALCDRHDALLIVDEVQTGIGRTGTFLAAQGEGVEVDAACVSKALGGGLPIGALLTRGGASEVFEPGDHASTFGGGPLVASVARAVLSVVTAPGFLQQVRSKGERVASGLADLVNRHELTVATRGRGLMQGLVLSAPVAGKLTAALHGLGVLTVPAGPDVLRLVPALNIPDAELDEGLSRIDEALTGLTTAGES